MRHRLIPTRMAVIEKDKMSMGEDVETLNSHTLLVGRQNGEAALQMPPKVTHSYHVTQPCHP